MFLAHAGHWLVWILYTIPVFAVLIAVIVASMRARKLAEEDERLGDADGSADREDELAEQPGD